MKRFIQGEHRGQSTLLPESLDDYVSDTNPVRVVDVFVDELDLVNLGFDKGKRGPVRSGNCYRISGCRPNLRKVSWADAYAKRTGFEETATGC